MSQEYETNHHAPQTLDLSAEENQPAIITAETDHGSLPDKSSYLRQLANHSASGFSNGASTSQGASTYSLPTDSSLLAATVADRSATPGEVSGQPRDDPQWRGLGSHVDRAEWQRDRSTLWGSPLSLISPCCMLIPLIDRIITTIMVNLSAIMERTDEQLLPAVYAFVARSFDATPSQLGYLTQSRALVQALASPFGGFAGHYFNRIWVIMLGCSIWGCMTALFSGCTSIAQGYLLWAVNGIGLSLVIPTGQSLTADYFSDATRGRAFGALYLTGALGAMLGAVYATNLGHLQIFGVEGWRFAFFTVAMVSLAIGVLNFAFARDPRCRSRWQLKQEVGEGLGTGALLLEMRDMCLMPTFLIIILQGIVGSTPWNALVFLTLYMQTIGMSDRSASLLVSLFLGGSALGGLLGGWLGDVAAARLPNTGRIAVCQFSVFIGVPLSILLFKGLPLDGASGTVATYGLLLGLMGLLISWAAPACNNPIFAEIVPPHLRTMIYAFDRSFESAIAASAAPLVGILAEKVFGWEGSATPEGGRGQLDRDLHNARALGNALLVCMTLPWGLCCLFYIGLYFTYPKDRARAEEAARALHEVLPQDAVQPDPEGAESTKSESRFTDGTVSDTERQRLLLSPTYNTDSSLELTSLAEAGELASAERSGKAAQGPEGETAALLQQRQPQSDDPEAA